MSNIVEITDEKITEKDKTISEQSALIQKLIEQTKTLANRNKEGENRELILKEAVKHTQNVLASEKMKVLNLEQRLESTISDSQTEKDKAKKELDREKKKLLTNNEEVKKKDLEIKTLSMEIKQYEQKTKAMTLEIDTLKDRLKETIATKDTLLAVNRQLEVEAMEDNQGKKPGKQEPNNEPKTLDDQEKSPSHPIQEIIVPTNQVSLLVEPLSKDQDSTHSNSDNHDSQVWTIKDEWKGDEKDTTKTTGGRHNQPEKSCFSCGSHDHIIKDCLKGNNLFGEILLP